MKLSELKALIAEVEAAKITEDPMVHFWIPRTSGQTVGMAESEQFVNYALDVHAIRGQAARHRISACSAHAKTVYSVGDFWLPLMVTHFYKY